MSAPQPEAAPALPEGFALSGRASPFLDLIGPVYEAGTGADYRMALRIDARHANSHGQAHGGVLATLLDVFLGRLALLHTPPMAPGVTVHLALDYLGPVPQGAVAIASGSVDKRGRDLAHAIGVISVDGRPAVRATGIFKLLRTG